MKSKVDVKSGVCGMGCTITATCDDGQNVNIAMDTNCPHVAKLSKEVENIDGFGLLFQKTGLEAAQKLPHLACPVPVAIVKAVEVAMGMALPADVSISVFAIKDK